MKNLVDGFSSKNKIIKFLIVSLLLISFGYSTSYQQFRHYDFSKRMGINDAMSYVKMSNGDYNVSVHHSYRFIY